MLIQNLQNLFFGLEPDNFVTQIGDPRDSGTIFNYIGPKELLNDNNYRYLFGILVVLKTLF